MVVTTVRGGQVLIGANPALRIGTSTTSLTEVDEPTISGRVSYSFQDGKPDFDFSMESIKDTKQQQ